MIGNAVRPSLDEIVREFHGYQARRLTRCGEHEAAVLVPLRSGSEGAEVVLTRRSSSLGAHAGQVAFPGGRIDRYDPTAQAAAVREANEELGIIEDRIKLICELDHVRSSSGYHVTPWLGCLSDDVSLIANPAEVARVFSVPLSRLLVFGDWERRPYAFGSTTGYVWHFPWEGEDVWGMTAHILRRMLELIGSFTDFEHHGRS